MSGRSSPDARRADARRYAATANGKQVRRRGAIRRKYGLTPAQYAQVFEDSDGLCALCYERVATHLDHDPATGLPRGALCAQHNHALGMFGDNEAGLLDALDYLRSVPV